MTTSASLDLTTEMFTDALPPAADLIINEVDFDHTSTDDAQLIEILNPRSSAVTLDGYHIDLVNG